MVVFIPQKLPEVAFHPPYVTKEAAWWSDFFQRGRQQVMTATEDPKEMEEQTETYNSLLPFQSSRSNSFLLSEIPPKNKKQTC